jgi:di/tricarboxylate transporter
MTPQIALVFAITGVAVALFATERLRVDVVALLVLLTLALTGLVSTEEAFQGFANPAVITVWAIFIVSAGLFRTGVADMIGERILRLSGPNEPRLIAVIMLTCGTMSAFMNNIGATAVLLPAVVGVSRRTKVALSRLLIPLSFSSLIGGNMTLIGTPPNILASSILDARGLPSLGFFDYLPTGAIIFGTGLVFMVLVGRYLLPVRASPFDRQHRRLRAFVSEVRVLPSSPLAGKTLLESRLGADHDVTVLDILRDGERRSAIHRDTRIEALDLLIVESALEHLMSARDSLGLAIEPERKLEATEGNSAEPEDVQIVEVTLAPRAPLVGRTLREENFRERFGFTALAVHRRGELITERLRDIRLRVGDTLLLRGPRHRLAELEEHGGFLVLEPVMLEQRRRRKAPLALGVLVLVLTVVALGGLHVSLAMVIGAVMMVLTRCLTMDEAYASIDWRSVFLIAGMLPLGTAMEHTGAARWLAEGLVGLVGALGPLVVLGAIYVLASLITQPMSNAAATVLLVPVAIDIALSMDADPRPFVLATVIGASTSFLTPVGHQANVLVMGPGGYRFGDYLRAGGPLSIVLLVAMLLTLPVIWPLYP